MFKFKRFSFTDNTMPKFSAELPLTNNLNLVPRSCVSLVTCTDTAIECGTHIWFYTNTFFQVCRHFSAVHQLSSCVDNRVNNMIHINVACPILSRTFLIWSSFFTVLLLWSILLCIYILCMPFVLIFSTCMYCSVHYKTMLSILSMKSDPYHYCSVCPVWVTLLMLK